MRPEARTFVLVHGAWHGGWCWQRVADLLVKAGHRAFTPTLTGLGERYHLLNESVNLSTHIADVVNVLKWERLSDVVLCGHSYGGFVISGVVEQMPEAIASMVFLDAFVPENGQSLSSIVAPAMRERIATAVRNRELTIAPIPAKTLQVNAKDRAWVEELCISQPIATFLEKVILTGAREGVPEKSYIRATHYESAVFDAALEMVRAMPLWSTFELPCGHDIMIDMPEVLAELLRKQA